jgi:LysW-gamma-L-lysine/LysW-L-ornithine aminotransferase
MIDLGQRTALNIIATERSRTSGVYPKRELALVRGKGALVWDEQGGQYIDCTSGHGVANLGHCHPAIVAAVSQQAGTLITCSETFYNDRRAELMERLVSHLPVDLERLFLCNSGTEAVEAAIKFARLSTGRAGIVATMRGFHGRTLGALSATWERKYRQPFQPLVPGFTHVPFDNLDAARGAIDGETAAVIVEVVQGEGGVRPGSTGYFQGLRDLCDEHGALLIVDEVQTGFARTGRWFACEHHDLLPDLLCMGKAIAGGLPMGAVAIGKRVGDLPVGAHGSTFGGNPLACAAAIAALDVYQGEQLAARAADLGSYLLQRLHELESPLVREVRGLGLMVGIELKSRVTPFLAALMERGVLALPAGPTVLRLLPPLVIEQEQLDLVVEAIGERLDEAARSASEVPE